VGPVLKVAPNILARMPDRTLRAFGFRNKMFFSLDELRGGIKLRLLHGLT
jgi:hypothetical protein